MRRACCCYFAFCVTTHGSFGKKRSDDMLSLSLSLSLPPCLSLANLSASLPIHVYVSRLCAHPSLYACWVGLCIHVTMLAPTYLNKLLDEKVLKFASVLHCERTGAAWRQLLPRRRTLSNHDMEITLNLTPRVQVPNNHKLSKILTYIATILKPSTSLLGPLDPWGKIRLLPGALNPQVQRALLTRQLAP